MKPYFVCLFAFLNVLLLAPFPAYSTECRVCKTESQTLKTCFRCKQATYCSVEHQKIDWKAHQADCEISPLHLEMLRKTSPKAATILESIAHIGFQFTEGEIDSADRHSGAEKRLRYFNFAFNPRKELRENLAQFLVGEHSVGAYPILLERSSYLNPDDLRAKTILEQRLQTSALFVLKAGGSFKVPFTNLVTFAKLTKNPAIEPAFFIKTITESPFMALPEVKAQALPFFEIRISEDLPSSENIEAVFIPAALKYVAQWLFPDAQIIVAPPISRTLTVPLGAFSYEALLTLPDMEKQFELDTIPDFLTPLHHYLLGKPTGSLIFTHATRLTE
jgi:hypothetical protein